MDSFENQTLLLIKRQGCVREVHGCSAAAKLDGHFHMRRTPPQNSTQGFSQWTAVTHLIGQPECKRLVVRPITFQVLLPFQNAFDGLFDRFEKCKRFSKLPKPVF